MISTSPVPVTRKPSFGVLRALRKIAAGRRPTEDFGSQSEWGGWTGTVAAINRYGLVDWDGPALTEAGKNVLARWP